MAKRTIKTLKKKGTVSKAVIKKAVKSVKKPKAVKKGEIDKPRTRKKPKPQLVASTDIWNKKIDTSLLKEHNISPAQVVEVMTKKNITADKAIEMIIDKTTPIVQKQATKSITEPPKPKRVSLTQLLKTDSVKDVLKERLEQINKHGFTVKDDAENYPNGEIRQAMIAILMKDPNRFPDNWTHPTHVKMFEKTDKELLTIVLALGLAEQDRRSYKE